MAKSLGKPDAATETALRIRMLSDAIWMNAGQWQAVLLKPGGFLPAMRNSRHLFWRSFVQTVDQFVESERKRIIVFEGWEHLKHAREQGRGIILVTYHSPASSIASSILTQSTNIGPVLTLSPAAANWLVESNEPTLTKTLDAEQIAAATMAATRAQKSLNEGGIVQIYNDIHHRNARTLRYAVGDRWYDFKIGFAELALLTHAIIIPAYSTHDITGRIRMVFLPPFQTINGDHQTQVRHLVEQYAQFLTRTWQDVPESIGWYIAQHHLERPLIQSGQEH